MRVRKLTRSMCGYNTEISRYNQTFSSNSIVRGEFVTKISAIEMTERFYRFAAINDCYYYALRSKTSDSIRIWRIRCAVKDSFIAWPLQSGQLNVNRRHGNESCATFRVNSSLRLKLDLKMMTRLLDEGWL